MTKPYLLIAGDNYYPSAYTDDWIGCYSSYTEATEASEQYAVRRGMWYEIVDLREWMENTTFDTFGPTGLIGDPQ